MLLYLFLLLIVIVPITNFFHEFGHAAVAKMFRIDNVTIHLGSGPELFTLRLFNIMITIHLLFFIGGYSKNTDRKDISAAKQGMIALGGPISNILLTVLLYSFGNLSYHLLQLAIAFNLWVALMNLLPFKLFGKKSDGYVVMELLYGIMAKRK